MNSIFNIFDFGAIGDGKNINTKAIQKALDENNLTILTQPP